MVNTYVTVPGICLRKLLRPVELSEAIIDTDAFRKFLILVSKYIISILRSIVRYKSIQTGVQCPTFLVIELYEKLKFEIFRFMRLKRVSFATCSATFSSFAILFSSFLVFLGGLCLFLIARLLWLAILLVVKVWGRADPSFVKDLLESHFIVELKRTALTLGTVTVDAGYWATLCLRRCLSILLLLFWACLWCDFSLTGNNSDEIRQIFELLATWIARASKYSLILLTNWHFSPARCINQSWCLNSSPFNKSLIVPCIWIDTLSSFQVLQEQRAQLSKDLKMGIYKCPFQIEEHQSWKYHFIYVLLIGLVSKNWGIWVNTLFKQLHFV